MSIASDSSPVTANDCTGDCRGLSRRVVTSAALAVATGVTLAACASPAGGQGQGGQSGQVGPTTTAPFEVPLAEVPVGGGAVLPAHRVVVTQPVAGEVHAFSAICTHQGCQVSRVDAKGIFCACHSSFFDASDGHPTAGPATTALPSVPATLAGDTITVG